jgi:biotin transport system ATP-binding protein
MLKVANVSHKFPDGTIGIDNASLSVEKGEFVVLSGRNGSGKTVLAKHFNGLLFPSSGDVFFDGKPVRKHLPWVRQRVGFVFQNSDSQIVGQTVEDDIAFGPRNLRLTNDEIDARVETALESTGLVSLRHARPYTLSGGEKRRLAIASVLAMGPSLIVLDEPFSNLDYPGVRQVLAHIVRIHGEGTTIVLITHELEKSLAHASRLVVMDRGTIRFDGAPVEIIDRVEEYGIKKPHLTGSGIGGLSWLQ